MFKSVLIAATLIGATQPARAEVFLENLTWTELRDQVAAGTTTVIVPIGGTEQSGPHLALGKHNARVKVLSQRIAERLDHTLVAPVIAYVPEGSVSPPTDDETIDQSKQEHLSRFTEQGRRSGPRLGRPRRRYSR